MPAYRIATESIDTSLALLEQDGWQNVTKSPLVKKRTRAMRAAGVRVSMTRGQATPLAFFRKLVDDEFCQKVFLATSQHVAAANKAHKEYFGADDVLCWVMAMVYTICQEQEVKKWGAFCRKTELPFITKTKLKTVHKNVTCEPDDLTAVINTNLKILMTPPSQWALDETVLACEINEAPTVFLPRKPHPTGLRVYSCVGHNDNANRPFCFGVVNDAKTPHLKLPEILEQAEMCFDTTREEPFAMTADCFFETLSWAADLDDGKFATMAMGRVRNAKLLDVFTHGLQKKQVRTYYNGTLTAQVWVDNDTVAVVSNQFAPEGYDTVSVQEEIPERSDPVMLVQAKSAMKMTTDTVITLATGMGKSTDGTKEEIVARMFGVDVRDLVANDKGAQDLFVCDCEHEFRDEQAVQCDYCDGWTHVPECAEEPGDGKWHCLRCRTDTGDPSSDAKWNWDVEERRNKKFTVKQLKEEIGKRNGKTSGSKEALVKRLTSLTKPGDELAQAEKKFKQAMLLDTSPKQPEIIKHYGDTFNPVDKFNRLMYEVWFHPRVYDYKRRYLLGMISMLLVNAWVAHGDYHSAADGFVMEPLKVFGLEIVELFSKSQ